jgi:hypothetical protein
LIYFNPSRPIKIKTNISEFVISGILSQPIDKQLTSNPPIYEKSKGDNFKNLDSGKSSHLTIEKESKYS